MYLIGRFADPLFGIASGLLAFKLHDDRQAKQTGRSFLDMVKDSRARRAEAKVDEEREWEELRRELDKK